MGNPLHPPKSEEGSFSGFRPCPPGSSREFGRDHQLLRLIQHDTFSYFLEQFQEKNGLITDKNDADGPVSITAVGLGLSCYVMGAEIGLLSRAEALRRILITLRFLSASPQGSAADATGYKGFYYHFLDRKTGRRTWECELSTMDTALLLAGVLLAAQYFRGANAQEAELRELADFLYRRVDWRWAQNGANTISHGWTPESDFLPQRWDDGYSEATLLYILALGSPTMPAAPAGYREWAQTFAWRKVYDWEYIFAGPLFIHQLSQVWLDLRGLQDDITRQHDLDYFENSRRATYAQRQYAIDNPRGFAIYSANAWGITASDGPGPAEKMLGGKMREFYGYKARGIPLGPDDGTLSPWAALSSLPFAPELVCPALRHMIERIQLKRNPRHGLEASYNFTFPEHAAHSSGWISPYHFGLNEGPVVLMIENYFSELSWKTFRLCPYVSAGLRLAGFRGGWLEKDENP